MKNFLFFSLLVVVASVANSQDLTVGLRLHYDFEGHLGDQSIYHRNLTVQNGTENYTNISWGDQAFDFDGSTGLRLETLGTVADFNEIALCFWMKAGTGNSGAAPILTSPELGLMIMFDESTGLLSGSVNGFLGLGPYQSSTNVADGSWHHVVLQNDGTDTQLYVNGVLENTFGEAYTGGGGSNIMWGGDGVAFLDGALDDFRMYDRPLTHVEVSMLYGDKVISVPTPDLDRAVTFFPNPTSDVVNIDLAGLKGQVDVRVMDVTGRFVAQYTEAAGQVKSYRLPEATGLYLVTVANEGEVVVQRVLKN